MTPYEIAYRMFEPFLPALQGTVAAELRRLAALTGSRPIRLLDVGGRKSPYTIGLQAAVTVVDLPRRSEVQRLLHLGLTDRIMAETRRRRSNIERIVLEDMTLCSLPDASFDGVVSVEVIEPVPDDEAFVRQIARVLKPGGWLVLTTPNGDYVRNEPPEFNPDHLRHYRRDELHALLAGWFATVHVRYAIKTGRFRYRGLRSMSWRRPARMLDSMACNVVSRLESRGLGEQPRRTAHLIAVAHKEGDHRQPLDPA